MSEGSAGRVSSPTLGLSHVDEGAFRGHFDPNAMPEIPMELLIVGLISFALLALAGAIASRASPTPRRIAARSAIAAIVFVAIALFTDALPDPLRYGAMRKQNFMAWMGAAATGFVVAIAFEWAAKALGTDRNS
jgi:phosphoglycerol transferase MdoB-like AlkP superfamily enzyme